MTLWLNTVETTCIDAAREKTYLDWYKSTHLDDVLKATGYLSGRLFVNKDFRDGRGRFLSMYEIESDDIDKTLAERLAARQKERESGSYKLPAGAKPSDEAPRVYSLFAMMWRDVLWKPITECIAGK